MESGSAPDWPFRFTDANADHLGQRVVRLVIALDVAGPVSPHRTRCPLASNPHGQIPSLTKARPCAP
eukprot:UN21975